MRSEKSSRRPHFRIFLEYLIAFMTITLVVAIPLLPLYQVAFSNARDSVVKDSYTTLQKGFLTIENEILGLNDLASSLYSDTSFQKLSRMNGEVPADEVYNLIRARDMMRNSGYPSDVIFDQYMMFRRNSLAISRTQIVTDAKNLQANYLNIPSMTYEEWFSYIFDNDKRIVFKKNQEVNYRVYILDEFVPKNIIHCILSLPINNMRITNSVMLVLLDSDKLLKALATEEIISEGFLYLLNGDDEIIYSYGYDGQPLNAVSGISESTWGGMDTTLLKLGQSQTGLKVVAGIPNSVFASQIKDITTLLMLYVLLALFVGVSLALYMAYRQSKPISSILDTLGNMLSQPSRSYKRDKFAYIENSLMQIDKTNQRYKEQLADLHADIKISLTQKLLNGKPCDLREIKMFKSYYKLEHPVFMVVAISLPTHQLEHFEVEHVESVNMVLAAAIQEYISCRYILHNLTAGTCALILNLSQEQSENCTELNHTLMKIRSMLLEVTGISISMGVSRTGTGLYNLSRCFSEARMALAVLEEESVSSIKHFEKQKEDALTSIFDPATAQKIHDLIMMGEKGLVEKVFHYLKQNFLSHPVADSAEIRQVLLAIRNTLAYSASLIGKDDRAENDLSPYREEDTPEEAIDALIQSALKLAERVQQVKKSKNTRLRETLLDYLENNYGDANLCAAQMAEKFGLSEKYLFSFIKEHTGKSFGEYVEKIRLKHAVQLLGETGLSIGLICERVGFNSMNTFYKAFKRAYDVSPSVWRSNRQSAKEITGV